MLDIYSLVSVLPRLPLLIESLACFDDNIFVGTKEGHLLMYKIELRGTYNKDGTEEAEVSLVKSSKNFSKKPISQLAVIKEFQLLISLSDTVISIHDFGSESGSFPVLDSITKTRGATLFAISVLRDPAKLNEPKVNMCVVVRQRLLVFHLKGWERKFEEAANVKLVVPDTPKAVIWANEALYVNVAGEYQRMKLNGDFFKLFSIDKNQEPKIVLLADGRLAFGLDDKCVFSNQEGNISKEPLIWSGVPQQIAQDAPFLIALFPMHVEIRPYDPPGKGGEAVQKVDIQKAKIVCEARDKGIVYIASPTAVWALRTAPSIQLIDRLVLGKQFELAENIAKYSSASEAVKAEWFQRIRNLYAFQLFCDQDYKKAFDLFFQLGTEPPQVIGLFPDFLPSNVRNSMTYPSKCPELTGSALEKATFALIEYLTEWRQKLNFEIMRTAEGRSEEETAKTLAQMQIVDTTLLKCYLATNPAMVSPLLRLPDNHCNFEESERSLKKARRFDELIILYKNKGFHKKALEFLRRELENPESTLNGHQRMARYLVEIAKDELELVFQFIRFVIKASPEQGLQIFTDELYECDIIPREKVFEFLTRNAPELLMPYLEHVINIWSDNSEIFHTALGEAYIKKAAGLLKQGGDSDEVAALRKTLQLFLGRSVYYEPALLLTHLPLDCMFEERALVLGRMQRFEQAIGLYVHVLKQAEQAEKFCEQFYDRNNIDGSQVYYLLFKTYVRPPEPNTLGVLLNDLPTTERNLEEALRILRRYSNRIDYAKGMELVPFNVTVNELGDFLLTAFEVLTSKRRQVELMKNLHYAEYLQVQLGRIRREGENFTLTEDDVCDICKKRIGKNTAFIRTPDKKLKHYMCGSSARQR